jgi:hypothetical protein
MIANNLDRPVWHSEIIQYFVEMYFKIKNVLIQEE